MTSLAFIARAGAVLVAAAGLTMASMPLAAQVQAGDPSSSGAYSDMAPVPNDEAHYGTAMPPAGGGTPAPYSPPPYAPAPPSSDQTPAGGTAAVPSPTGTTFQQNDVLGAAEGVFGRGAEGLAKLIERILKEQGEPNAYIAGREAGAALAVGVRYGSGTLSHKVEGQRPVYWTGPSLGFDLGANGSKTFVLVYNLHDSQELFRRFPAAEGTAYVVGGFTASYLRRGDVVLIPIRVGVGWRLGVNVGYMKFTEKSDLLPF